MWERIGTGRAAARWERRGIAMIPTLLVVAGLSIFALALLTSGLSTKRTVNHQGDDHKLSSAVESVAMLATEDLWSGYLDEQGGAAGTIGSFRTYLDTLGIPDSGVGGPPEPDDGTDLTALVDLPNKNGRIVFNDVNVDAMQIVRRDELDSTQLYLTVSASTNRGAGLVNPVLNRAVQQVYTVEPEEFAGFDFAVLANNVNCIFCHTNVDSVDRYYNTDSSLYDSFDRVKVGALETLMIRHDLEINPAINDFDADSFIAGTLYARGTITDQDGIPLTDWNELSFQGYQFDSSTGKLEEDFMGDLMIDPFSPAGDPPDALENLYLGYPTEYAEMVDGNLPTSFPAPIPDDGGIDPVTGLPDATGAGNKVVDDFEFHAASLAAEGAITAGIITHVPHGDSVDTVAEYASALFVGNTPSVQQTLDGNLILSGTEANPITIDGTVAIDGDLIINGYVKGEGSLIVRGNVYIPTDLEYLDGKVVLETDDPSNPTGPRTFGVAQDGTKNALGIAAGGNMLIGDYLTPGRLQPDWTWENPEKYDYVSGDVDDDWNFSLGEMAIFNRAEWAKTQPTLPGAQGQADLDPSTWTLVNPNYAGPDYVPRYYHFGPGDTVPVYNKGNIYYDASTGTWRGDAEVAIFWDASLLTFADPDDPGDPLLYNVDGTPRAVISQVVPNSGWIGDDLYKLSIEYFEDNRPWGKPMGIDGLLYTNNAIFTLVSRITPMWGRMILNGSIVCADLGMLVPGFLDYWDIAPHSPISNYAIGLQLNYDVRVKDMLNVKNPFQVQLKRTLWNPTANIL